MGVKMVSQSRERSYTQCAGCIWASGRANYRRIKQLH